MGLNKCVEFSTAKLLKEKGFDELCSHAYKEVESPILYLHQDKKYNNSFKKEWQNTVRKNSNMDNATINRYSAPTIAEVVMWLYEKHGIWIEITMGKDHTGIWFDWDIFSTILPRKDDEVEEEDVEYEDNPNEKWLDYKTTYNSMIEDERFAIIDKESYSSPTETYEAAIEYTLNNLV